MAHLLKSITTMVIVNVDDLRWLGKCHFLQWVLTFTIDVYVICLVIVKISHIIKVGIIVLMT